MTEIQIFATVFGLLIGSFLNVIIYRLPKGISVVKPRSTCGNCQTIVSWYDNIPVMSFVFLRGKCRKCGIKLSYQYPLIEIVTGLAAFYFLGHSSVESLPVNFFNFSIFCILLCHFLIDLKHYLLLDSLNIYLAILFGFYGIFHLSWISMALGVLIGGGIPYLVTWLFYKIRGKIGLGGGDIKLWSALGIFLGPLGIIHNIWLSCSLGAIVGVTLIGLKITKRDDALPFGPFIIVVSALQIFFPNVFQQFIGNLLGF